jgi:hypothetical protein
MPFWQFLTYKTCLRIMLRTAVLLVVSVHFFGEASEQRPQAIRREDRPAAFAGRSSSRLMLDWDTCGAYTGEYPIPPQEAPHATGRASRAVILRNSPGEIVSGSGGENVTVNMPSIDIVRLSNQRPISSSK